MALFGLYKTRKEKAAEEAEQLRKAQVRLQARQRELGDLLFQGISAAARKNTISHRFNDGKTSTTVQLIRVIKLPQNGDRYSILVGMDDMRCSTQWAPERPGYPILQADVTLLSKGRELSVFYGSYGTEKTEEPVSVNAFDNFLSRTAHYVRAYQLFH